MALWGGLSDKEAGGTGKGHHVGPCGPSGAWPALSGRSVKITQWGREGQELCSRVGAAQDIDPEIRSFPG